MAFNPMFALLAMQNPEAAAQVAAAEAPPPVTPTTAPGIGEYMQPQTAFPNQQLMQGGAPLGTQPTQQPAPAPQTPAPAPQQPQRPDTGKLDETLRAIASTQPSGEREQFPPPVPPPGGRGMALPSGNSEILRALQAGLAPGANTVLPSLGALISRRY